MSRRLVPGERVPLPKHQLLRVLTGWDASRPEIKVTRSCVSVDAQGKVVDLITSDGITKDLSVWVEDGDYVLDLNKDTGLTYIFSLHAAGRMEEVKTLSFAVVTADGEAFCRFDKPAQFGYSSVALAALSYRNEWRIRALGVEAHAPDVLQMLPVLKAL